LRIRVKIGSRLSWNVMGMAASRRTTSDKLPRVKAIPVGIKLTLTRATIRSKDIPMIAPRMETPGFHITRSPDIGNGVLSKEKIRR